MPAPKFVPLRFGFPTLPAILRATARRLPDKVFLRVLAPDAPEVPLAEVTFAAFERGVRRAAAALASLGLEAGDRLLLLADNSVAWQELALGAQCLRAEPAALFANLAAEPAAAIAARVKPRVAFVSGPAQWEKLAPQASQLAQDGLKAVVTTAPLSAESLPGGVRQLLVSEVTGEGARAPSDAEWARLVEQVQPADPFILIFTSGTTGRPKGVRVPQRAIVCAIEGGNASVGTSEADLGVHFLPFAHVAGHDQFFLALAQGHSLLFVQHRKDIERAFALGPTYAFSVPLVYDRFRQAVEAKVAAMPQPLRAILRRAIAAGARVRVDGSRGPLALLLTFIADRLVARGLRARLGGRLRALFAGGAQVSPSLFRFFEGLGIPCVELYGMTETAGLISSNFLRGERRQGAAGVVTPDHQLRFDEGGELLVRGPLLLSGFLEAEDNASAFTTDGFFRTGDRGRIDGEGFLRIEGRKKHLLALSTGKKVVPEPLRRGPAVRDRRALRRGAGAAPPGGARRGARGGAAAGGARGAARLQRLRAAAQAGSGRGPARGRSGVRDADAEGAAGGGARPLGRPPRGALSLCDCLSGRVAAGAPAVKGARRRDGSGRCCSPSWCARPRARSPSRGSRCTCRWRGRARRRAGR
jgi:long-chain acyl-CoA synthetase